MGARRGLGRGLNSGRGIDSVIPPKKSPTRQNKVVTQKDDGEKKEEVLATAGDSQENTKKQTVEVQQKENELLTEADMQEKAELQAIVQQKKEKAQPASADNAGVFLPIVDIEPNREQPRKVFDEEALAELADSIRQYGVLSPLLVQKNGDYYEIIAGERRWRAAKLAGLKEIPVIIREYTRQEIVEISLIENIQREDLNPIEEARAYKRLLTEFQLTQETVAERVSKSRAAITNSTRLLKLDARVQEMLIEGSLTAGHARALLSISDAELQYDLAKRIEAERLSVREVEKLVKNVDKLEQDRLASKGADPLGFLYRDMEERLTGALGTKVAIKHGKAGKGKIEISYHSDEELERLLEVFASPLKG